MTEAPLYDVIRITYRPQYMFVNEMNLRHQHATTRTAPNHCSCIVTIPWHCIQPAEQCAGLIVVYPKSQWEGTYLRRLNEKISRKTPPASSRTYTGPTCLCYCGFYFGCQLRILAEPFSTQIYFTNYLHGQYSFKNLPFRISSVPDHF